MISVQGLYSFLRCGLIAAGPHPPVRRMRLSMLVRLYSRTKRYLSPPCLVTASITRSRLKLPGFWRGGNSRKLCSHCAT